MQHSLFGDDPPSADDDGWDHYKAARAGELLAAFELAMAGANVTIASEGRSYDLIADVNNKLIRVQVKTTRCPQISRGYRFPQYIFSLARGSHKGHTRSTKYSPIEHADLFALVALDRMAVVFMDVAATKGITKIGMSTNQFRISAIASFISSMANLKEALNL